MKSTLLSIAVAAALSIAAIGAQAAQESTGDSVQIKAPPGFRFEPQEFGDYRYSYALSNGETIRFTQRVAHYYAQIDGNPKVEIFPVGPGKFVTRAGVELAFADQGYELAIDNYERLPMAAQLPANTLVVARR